MNASSRRNLQGDTARILDAAEDQGFTVEQTRKNHFLVYSSTGEFVTSFAGTIRNTRKAGRNLLNPLAALKAAGFVWPPPPKRIVRAERRRKKEGDA